MRVVDAPTGADITAQVLTQIILELDTPKVDSLPVPLLMRLIRMNDQLVKDFIEKYFNQALKSFLDYQQQVEEQIRRTHGLPSLFPSVSAWTKAMLGPLAAGFASRPQEPSTPAAPAAAPADTAEMQRRLQELETQNERLRRKRVRKKPVRRPKKGR